MKYLALLGYLLASMCSTPVHAIHPYGWDKNTVFVLPEDGRTPIVTAIQAAKKTLHMAAYRLSDPQILQALEGARKKGVQIKLLIQPTLSQHEKSHAENAMEKLKSLGIEIYTLSTRFSQAHYKLILVDETWGILGTGNLDTESFDGEGDTPACRDFFVPVLHPVLVREALRVFNADIQDHRIVPHPRKLIWGPDYQRSTFLKMINSAKKSIHIYQQDIQDKGILEALAGAARAGVDVKIIMMPFPFSKTVDNNIPNQTLITQAGGKVALNTKYYIHAKVMIVDERDMYIGSCNFYPESLDRARELGIIIQSPKAIHKVLEIFNEDWKISTLFKV